MRRFSDRSPLNTLSELNVTPLLDLAFVLLIIFMLTTPLMENSTDLVLPTSEASSKAVDPAKVEHISIDKGANITLNEQTLSLEALERDLTALKATQPDMAVVLRAHKELPVQNLIDIMDVVKKVGISRIGVVSTHPTPAVPGAEPSPAP